jgi:hypothetical protein
MGGPAGTDSAHPLAHTFLSFCGVAHDEDWPSAADPVAEAEMTYASFCKLLRQGCLFANTFTQYDALGLFSLHMQRSARGGTSVLKFDGVSEVLADRAEEEHPGLKRDAATAALLKEKLVPLCAGPRPSCADWTCDLLLHNCSKPFLRLMRHVFGHYAKPEVPGGDGISGGDGRSSVASLRVSSTKVAQFARDFELVPDLVSESEVGAAMRAALAESAAPDEEGEGAPPLGAVVAGSFPEFVDTLILLSREAYASAPLDELFPEGAARLQALLAHLAT